MTVGAPLSITVRVRKYDGTQYRRWRAKLARREGSLIVLDAEFEFDVAHDLLGEISRGTKTIEYYWLDRWYNVFRFLNDGGSTRLYYCNINTPPMLKNDELTYIDLDIDLVVQPDFSYQVLDLDDFEANARLYEYSEEVKTQARAAIVELTGLIETRQFPFAESSVSSVVDCS